MSAIEIASFAAAVASLALAVVAIWLSVFFYRMSSEISESTKEAAKGIGASVDRLEKLFDKLYADTFSMMKDTVSDMRKHIWPEGDEQENKIAQEAEKRADDKVKALKNNVDKELSEFLKRQKVADERMSSMRDELTNVMDRIIAASRRVEIEAREETIRDHILSAIRSLQLTRSGPTAASIIDRLDNVFPNTQVLDELRGMVKEGILSYKGENISPDTVMQIRRGAKVK